jgi:hypothetical protein
MRLYKYAEVSVMRHARSWPDRSARRRSRWPPSSCARSCWVPMGWRSPSAPRPPLTPGPGVTGGCASSHRRRAGCDGEPGRAGERLHPQLIEPVVAGRAVQPLPLVGVFGPPVVPHHGSPAGEVVSVEGTGHRAVGDHHRPVRAREPAVVEDPGQVGHRWGTGLPVQIPGMVPDRPAGSGGGEIGGSGPSVLRQLGPPPGDPEDRLGIVARLLQPGVAQPQGALAVWCGGSQIERLVQTLARRDRRHAERAEVTHWRRVPRRVPNALRAPEPAVP